MSAPWMPLYVADFVADTGHLSAAQTGAYIMLIGHYWRVGSLPTDDRSLQRISRMTAQEWRNSKDILSAFFDSEWKHARVEKERAKADLVSQERRTAANNRWQAKPLKNNDAADAIASPIALQEQSKSNAISQPQSQSEGKKERNAREACLAVASFERFWNAYPEKVGKKPAAVAFLKVASEVDAILEGLARYIQAKPADRSWLNPATFINQRRWEDQPAPNSGAQNGRPSNGSRLLDAFDKLDDRLRPGDSWEARPPDARLLSFG